MRDQNDVAEATAIEALRQQVPAIVPVGVIAFPFARATIVAVALPIRLADSGVGALAIELAAIMDINIKRPSMEGVHGVFGILDGLLPA